MIKVGHIAKNFGSLKVFDDFSLEFPEKQITAILGPSGCGKTTLLNILAGLVKIDQGKVTTTNNVSYLFQEPRLLPWLTIRQNIALVLKDKMSVQEIDERVFENLHATGLTDFGDYYPAQLSGGMRQRAAMARAFSYDAPLLLMDEPFKSLDIKTRFQLIADFLELWRKQPRTVVIVTHDVKEAVLMGSKIVVLSDNPVRVLREFTTNVLQADWTECEASSILEREILQLILQ
jgi:NitT/TauT family transport system ATP-binding protein